MPVPPGSGRNFTWIAVQETGGRVTRTVPDAASSVAVSLGRGVTRVWSASVLRAHRSSSCRVCASTAENPPPSGRLISNSAASSIDRLTANTVTVPSAPRTATALSEGTSPYAGVSKVPDVSFGSSTVPPLAYFAVRENG